MAKPKVSDRQFASSKHRYTNPETGERCISVTSIVGNYADSGKIDRMVGAAVKIGRGYRAEWNEKRDRGSRIHLNIADWFEGRATDVLEGDKPYMLGARKFIRENKPRVLEVEFDMVSKRGVGGRGDSIVEMNDLTYLLDAKSGRQYPTELALQCAGYASMDGIIVYDDAGNAVDLRPLPRIDRWAGLYLTDEGDYHLLDVPLPLLGQTYAESQLAAVAAFDSLLAARLWADTQPKGPA